VSNTGSCETACPRPGVTSQLGAPLLLGALTVALVAQGAYYVWAQVCVAGLIVAALFFIPSLTRGSISDRAITLAAGALAGWAVVDAAVHDDLGAAVPYVVLLAGVVAVMVACSHLDEAARDVLLTGLIACGVLVAALAYFLWPTRAPAGAPAAQGQTAPTADEAIRVRWLKGPIGRELVELAGPMDSPAPEVAAGTSPGSAAQPVGPTLDDAERRLLQLLTEGRTNVEIAVELDLGEDDVAQRLARLLARLGTSSRAEATSLAFRGLAAVGSR